MTQHYPRRADHRHPAKANSKPSPKLAAFLSETVQAAEAGNIGCETARDLIRQWPTMAAPDLAAKAAALRKLAAPGALHRHVLEQEKTA